MCSQKDQSETPDQEETEKKYTVRRPRQLRSGFLLRQEEKKRQEAEAALALKQRLQEVRTTAAHFNKDGSED